MSVDIGRAMLEATTQGLRRRIFENAEIRDLADAVTGAAERTSSVIAATAAGLVMTLT